jgi:hypothetical protein
MRLGNQGFAAIPEIMIRQKFHLASGFLRVVQEQVL